MTERNLIRKLSAHQPEALEALMKQYAPYVGTIVRNIIGKYCSESDVEEIVADVFVAVWEHTDQLKAGKLRGYLAAIARNRAKNRIRSFHETAEPDEIDSLCAADDVEQEIDRKLLGELLQEVLHTLPQKDRDILVRYYYCYESIEHIAENLHISPSAVKMRLSRARKKMQQELIARGYAYEEDAPDFQKIRFAAI